MPSGFRQGQNYKLCYTTRGLKFQIWEIEGLNYLCREKKGSDQLNGYCAAGQSLLFSHMQKAGFLMTGLILRDILVDYCFAYPHR